MSKGRAILGLDIVCVDIVIWIHDSVCVDLHEGRFLVAHFKSLKFSINVEMSQRVFPIISRRASTSHIARYFLSKL
jgi:hypothetical protein